MKLILTVICLFPLFSFGAGSPQRRGNCRPPSMPQYLEVATISPTDATVSFKAIPNTLGYDIKVRGPGLGPEPTTAIERMKNRNSEGEKTFYWSTDQKKADTQSTVHVKMSELMQESGTLLRASTTYKVLVRAINHCGKGEFSNLAEFSTQAEAVEQSKPARSGGAVR